MLLAGRSEGAPRGSQGGRGGAPLGIGFLVLLSSAMGWGGGDKCRAQAQGDVGGPGVLGRGNARRPLAMFMPPARLGIITCLSGGEQC